MATEDIVNKPSHYTDFGIEPIDFLVAAGPIGAHVSHAIPYLMRAGKKLYPNTTAEQSEVIDLEKAVAWINRRIDYLKEAQDK